MVYLSTIFSSFVSLGNYTPRPIPPFFPLHLVSLDPCISINAGTGCRSMALWRSRRLCSSRCQHLEEAHLPLVILNEMAKMAHPLMEKGMLEGF
jgi:hypothetical protein